MRTGQTVGMLSLGLATLLIAVVLVFAWRGQSPPAPPIVAESTETSVPPSETDATHQPVPPQAEATPPGHQNPATADHSTITEGSPPSPEQASVAPVEAEASPQTLSADDQMKKSLIGFWFHQESGEHWIENRPDGTARLLLKLDFVASLLYGQRTTMELTWDVKDGVLTHTIVSGSPQVNVDSLVKAFGKTRTYEVLETTEQRMLLKSRNEPDKKDLWTRTPPPKEWLPSPEALDASPSESK